MARKPQTVTEAELAILTELWARATMTVRELSTVLYGGSSASELATVQKLLSRLEAKNCVIRQRDRWPHEFMAIVDRDEMIQRRLQLTADELCEGSLSPLLSHLVRTTKLSARDRAALRRLIDAESNPEENAGNEHAGKRGTNKFGDPLDRDGGNSSKRPEP